MKSVHQRPLGTTQYPFTPPLLLEEETYSKRDSLNQDGIPGGRVALYNGKTAESICKSYFMEQRWNFAEPEVDVGVDFLIHRNNNWDRIQVKKVIVQWDSNKQRVTHKFPFQAGGVSKQEHIVHRQLGPEDVDYFFHVFYSPYRRLIFETPISQIPLKDKGEHAGKFVQARTTCMTELYPIRNMSRHIDWEKNLVHESYHPRIFQEHPDFWRERDQQSTLTEFL